MKKLLLTFISGVTLFGAIKAQVNAYSFAQSSGTYTAISGGTVLGNTSVDDEYFVDPATTAGGSTKTGVGFPIGFSFTFNGSTFDKVGINTNGWISFGQSSLTPSVDMNSSNNHTLPLSQTSTASPAILKNKVGGLAMDLEGQTGSEIRIQTVGTAPNRVCVIQWAGFTRYGETGDNYNFQIRLNETSNTVSVVYGAFTNNTNSETPQVGLSGTAASDFNLRKVSTSWASSTMGTVNTDTCHLSSSIVPASGQTYTWTVPPACSGTPTAGSISGPTSVCGGQDYTLTLAGYSPGVSGLSFQWQSSTSLTGTYTNIAGATATTLDTNQTVATYYKCVVTCSGGSSSTTTAYTVSMNSPTACYCTPSNDGDNCIVNVTLNTSLNNTSAGCENSSADYYTSVPVGTATTSITGGTSVPLSVTVSGSATSNTIISVWIDYDHSGTFDASEWNQVATAAVPGSVSTISIAVPGNAIAGQTGMRVRTRSAGSSNGATDACSIMYSGETEDYVVTIVAAPACSGTPTAGTASASVDSVCSDAFSLILTGYSSGVSGLTFQWQSSATGVSGSYSNIPGATTAIYDSAAQSVTTYYQCVVSCGSSSANSTSTHVVSNPFMDCYCVSAATYSADEDIFNVTLATLNNTSTCSTTGTGSTSVLNKYSDYTSVAAPNLVVDSTYALSVQVGTCGTSPYNNAVKIYIDYNRNGSFDDSGELVYASDTTLGANTVMGSFTVPTTITNGSTMMRVVCKETGDTSTISSCGTYGYGETEDYLVTITGSTVGIKEVQVLNNVTIFPNPTSGMFNVVIPAANFNELSINVIDIQGKLVYSSSEKNVSSSYNKQINLEHLAKGLYYVKFTTEKGAKVQKLVIQ